MSLIFVATGVRAPDVCRNGHAALRSSKFACTSDRSRAGPKPVATSTRPVILPCGLRDLEPGRDRPASSPGPKEKRQPVAGVMCVTRAPHGRTAGVALQRVWGRSKYEFERPHGRSGPVTPPDLTRSPPKPPRRHPRLPTGHPAGRSQASFSIPPPRSVRRSAISTRSSSAWQVRVSRRLPDVESSLLAGESQPVFGLPIVSTSERRRRPDPAHRHCPAPRRRRAASIEPSLRRGPGSPRHPDQACSMRSSPSRLPP